MQLRGKGASAGIGLGRIVRITHKPITLNKTGQGYEIELERYNKALSLWEKENKQLESQPSLTKDQKEIFYAQRLLAQDQGLQEKIKAQLQQGMSASAGVFLAYQDYSKLLGKLEDPYLSQKAQDLEEIQNRLLELLRGDKIEIPTLTEPSILLVEEVTASFIARLDLHYVKGILASKGGIFGHGAILARQLSIPLLLEVEGLEQPLPSMAYCGFDGQNGRGQVETSLEELASWQEKEQSWLLDQQIQREFSKRKTTFARQETGRVMANITCAKDAILAKEAGADGIGLYRTEYLFMQQDRMPTRQEQYKEYYQVSSIFPDKEVVIRLLDLGADKTLPYLSWKKEDNPSLGLRGIRFLLKHQDLLKDQVKAILQASARYHNIKIMLPMITTIEEVRSFRLILEECKQEIQEEQMDYDLDCPVGIMVETPAAVVMARQLAREVDFFSLGSNDLTQYILACDRTNQEVEVLYDEMEISVLRMIEHTAKVSAQMQIPLSICGEAGAREEMIGILAGIGIRTYSVGIRHICKIKRRISQIDIGKYQPLAEKILTATSKEEIKADVDNL